MSKQFKRWAYTAMSGAFLLQVTGCTDTAIAVTALSTSVTAGGVLWLIKKITG